MLRAIGAAALCLMAGAGCAARLYRRAAALRDMQARLYAMRASALYARADCGAILRAGDFDNLAQAAEIAGADAGLLYQRDAVDTLLRQEERAVVIHVLHAVCNGSAEEQAAAFDYALERMAELCRQAEQKRDAQSRLFASLGALSGACALILTRAGREDIATMTTIAGLVIVLMMVVTLVAELLSNVQSIFGLY